MCRVELFFLAVRGGESVSRSSDGSLEVVMEMFVFAEDFVGSFICLALRHSQWSVGGMIPTKSWQYMRSDVQESRRVIQRFQN